MNRRARINRPDARPGPTRPTHNASNTEETGTDEEV